MKPSQPRVAPAVHKSIFSASALLVALFLVSPLHAEIMPLSQVQKGMKGYGLTVFEGTRVDKFDVQVLGVLHNIGPRQDLILVHVDSPVTDKSGVIAGMSGSPIYVDGKVIGALAYSWQFASDSIAGVTPIEQMLEIGSRMSTPAGSSALGAPMAASEFVTALTTRNFQPAFDKMMAALSMNESVTRQSTLPLAVPLSFSRFAPETLDRYGRYFEASGFMLVPAGSTSTGTNKASAASAKTPAFQPGDAIAGVLVDGDFSVAATGTVTYVDGDKVYAFGHPFLDMGKIAFPMAQSEVVTVLPNLARSFKFANKGQTVGSLTQDRFAGIMGTVGLDAEMIPVQLTLEGAGAPQTYNMQVIRHPLLSPLMLAMAADTVVASGQRAAGQRTIVLDSEIDVDGFPPVMLHEGWSGAEARQAIPQYLALVANYLMSNEFKDVPIRNVKIRLQHQDDLRIAKLVEASIDSQADGQIHPGDTIKVRATLKPFRGEPYIETFDVKIPSTMKPGTAYLYVGSGTTMNQVDFANVPPDPRTLEQVLGVIGRLKPSTDLVAGLYSQSAGSVTAGVYLPSLPPSMRAVVDDDSSNSAQAPVRYNVEQRETRPQKYIVDGAVKLDIRVARKL